MSMMCVASRSIIEGFEITNRDAVFMSVIVVLVTVFLYFWRVSIFVNGLYNYQLLILLLFLTKYCLK